eukprot:TRINITY_DN5350_c0_g1_i1.p1 TRINITY_DN5350_c0_g1~~TRINITY_DN5350_c0_g1_i1.p1  ORF type:complete len:449 (+),score=59.93 TRINITY_DN5350_c0_g1_i1:422-1768(+)
MSKRTPKRNDLTRLEVAQHNQEDDCWIIVEDSVYSISPSWLARHPGGRLPIVSLAGKDATLPFDSFHKNLRPMLKKYLIGTLVKDDQRISDHIADFKNITKELYEKGYFQTNYFFYAKLFVWVLLLFIAAMYFRFAHDSFVSHCISAAFLGFFWQQMAFIGHDLCHYSVTHQRDTDTIIAACLASFVGIGSQWWKRTHNVHHVVTNSLEFDPDIQHLPFLAVTEKYFKKFYSKYHERNFAFDVISRFFVSKQHYLYYFIMMVSRVNLYLQSIILHVRARDWIPFRTLDLSSLLVFWSWHIALIAYLPNWQHRVAYVAISTAINGLLAVQITISHFAMPVYEDVDEPTYEYDWVKTQFEHSMDVDCPVWLDWLHGGLQFQLVHHLFPLLPRHVLREVRDLYVLPYAKKWDFKYVSYDFIEANKVVIRTLNQAADAASNIPSEELNSVFG